MITQEGQTIKIFPVFLQRLIGAVCYAAQIYKVELRCVSPSLMNFLSNNT